MAKIGDSVYPWTHPERFDNLPSIVLISNKNNALFFEDFVCNECRGPIEKRSCPAEIFGKVKFVGSEVILIPTPNSFLRISEVLLCPDKMDSSKFWKNLEELNYFIGFPGADGVHNLYKIKYGEKPEGYCARCRKTRPAAITAHFVKDKDALTKDLDPF